MTSQFASSIIKLSSEGWADLACRKREPDECCIERIGFKLGSDATMTAGPEGSGNVADGPIADIVEYAALAYCQF